MKRGFTIIELIISIVLIAAVSIASLFIYLKGDKNVELLELDKTLEDALHLYYYINSSNNGYKYYKNDESSIVSCIKLETLVKDGLIDNESEFLTKYDSNTVFKFIVDNEGFATIEPVLDSSDKTCEYILIEESGFSPIYIPDIDYSIPDNRGEDWEVSYGYSVDAVENEMNQFKGDITFNMNLKQVVSVENINPLYIVVIMDRSGSMNGTPYTNAKNAVTSMITAFKGMEDKIKSKIKIASVYYGSSALKGVDFKSLSSLSTYSDLNFPSSATGGTNCASGLTEAQKIFDEVTNPRYVKVGIFLSDGVCSDKSLAKSTANTLKEDGIKLYAIAYGNNADKDTLKEISSSNNLFSSSASTISSTFKNLATKTVNESIFNPYNVLTFSIKLPSYFEFVGEINSNIVNKGTYRYKDELISGENILKRTVTISNSSALQYLNIADFDYRIKFLSDKYKEENSDDLLVGTLKEKELVVVENLLIEMTGSGVAKKTINVTNNLPKITINLSNNSVVN